jgi:hypothetical protein
MLVGREGGRGHGEVVLGRGREWRERETKKKKCRRRRCEVVVLER